MEMVAARLLLGEAPEVSALYKSADGWLTKIEEFNEDQDAVEAWCGLGIDGELFSKHGRFWVGATPIAVTVSCDVGAGHLFLVFDEEKPKQACFGFISDSAWIVENGKGFLDLLAKHSQETQEQYGNAMVP